MRHDKFLICWDCGMYFVSTCPGDRPSGKPTLNRVGGSIKMFGNMNRAKPSSHIKFVIATDGLAAAVVVGALVILALALIGAVIDRNIQSKVEFARQLETMNAQLQRSLIDAERL